MRNRINVRLSVLFLLATIAFAPVAALSQTQIAAPKNKYKVQDDIKLGNDAAKQVEQQFPILNDADATRYVERVGQRLVAAIPPQYQQSAFDYRFKIVNASDINAFALPGGPMFVNRGMIQAAKNEGEMAGVMAHEISHVALRHATAQATKQGSIGNQLGTIGLILGGAILGGEAGAQLGALGASAWMTKYSRAYETQADTLGAQIMARAGYDPHDLANMFQTIQGQEGRGGTPEWLSSHPDPGNRFQNINREADKLQIAENPPKRTADFVRVQTRFNSMPKAPTMAEIEKGIKSGNSNQGSTANGTYSGSVPAPSTRKRQYSGLITASVPSNWQEIPGQDSVQFAPEGAYGNNGITRGAMIGTYRGSSSNFLRDTQAYVDEILQGNTYLRKKSGFTQTTIGTQRGYMISLAGVSPVTGKNETVTVYTLQDRDRNIVYIATVAPTDEAYRYSAAFRSMLNSVRTN